MSSLNKFRKESNVIVLKNIELMAVSGGAGKENMVFTSVSNVLKTKHDTVKNTISNVR